MKKRMTDEEAGALTERVSHALDVPEPSPLFWEHFPERVRAAVAADDHIPAPPAVAWWRRPVVALGVAVLLVSGAAVATMKPWPRAVPAPVATDAVVAAGDEAWAVVSSTAASAGLDALGDAGFGVAPGDADAALDDLNDEERATFAALLQAEMRGGTTGGL